MSTLLAIPESETPLEETVWPPFDADSYLRIGDRLIAAAGAQPELGLRLARSAGLGPSSPPYWFIGTRVSTVRNADDSDIRFTTYTPYLGDIAKRIDDGDFGAWVSGIAEGFAAGLIHRVCRSQSATAGLTKARLALETSLAARDTPNTPPSRQVLQLSEATHHPEAVSHHFTPVEPECMVLRRRSRR